MKGISADEAFDSVTDFIRKHPGLFAVKGRGAPSRREEAAKHILWVALGAAADGDTDPVNLATAADMLTELLLMIRTVPRPWSVPGRLTLAAQGAHLVAAEVRRVFPHLELPPRRH